MGIVCTILLLALSRAEIIQRMRAPVVTQAQGMVQVYADCDESVRREFQLPVARFASETVGSLYRGFNIPQTRFSRAAILIHLGDIRTNDTRVVAKVATNGAEIVTRLYLKNPATSDLERFRREIVKAFVRRTKGAELSDAAAERVFRQADPEARLADVRGRLEDWLAGRLPTRTPAEDEEMIALMRKVLEPGHATRRDVLTFASRLYLYPPTFRAKFPGGYDAISLREAVKFAKLDPRVRPLARRKAQEIPIWGGGRGRNMTRAAELYAVFLLDLSEGEKTDDELYDILDQADSHLAAAMEQT